MTKQEIDAIKARLEAAEVAIKKGCMSPTDIQAYLKSYCADVQALLKDIETCYTRCTHFRFADIMSKLPSCNDCGSMNTCPQGAMQLGEGTRYNCAFWTKKKARFTAWGEGGDPKLTS